MIDFLFEIFYKRPSSSSIREESIPKNKTLIEIIKCLMAKQNKAFKQIINQSKSFKEVLTLFLDQRAERPAEDLRRLLLTDFRNISFRKFKELNPHQEEEGSSANAIKFKFQFLRFYSRKGFWGDLEAENQLKISDLVYLYENFFNTSLSKGVKENVTDTDVKEKGVGSESQHNLDDKGPGQEAQNMDKLEKATKRTKKNEPDSNKQIRLKLSKEAFWEFFFRNFPALREKFFKYLKNDGFLRKDEFMRNKLQKCLLSLFKNSIPEKNKDQEEEGNKVENPSIKDLMSQQPPIGKEELFEKFKEVAWKKSFEFIYSKEDFQDAAVHCLLRSLKFLGRVALWYDFIGAKDAEHGLLHQVSRMLPEVERLLQNLKPDSGRLGKWLYSRVNNPYFFR